MGVFAAATAQPEECHVCLARTRLVGNEVGMLVYGNARSKLIDSSITGNTKLGIVVLLQASLESTVQVRHTAIEGNGQRDITVRQQALGDGEAVGAKGDEGDGGGDSD